MATIARVGVGIIFLSLRFYAKTILVILRSAKSAISTNFEALNFDFYEIVHFLKDRIYKINKIQSP